MASHDAPRSSRIRPDLPQGGAIPERGTPDAIVHLLRLARSNPILNGERLAPKLLFLAALLNQELPAEFQVSPDDSRAALAIEGSSESVAEYAAASIGKFVMNPAIAPALEERSKAFIGLHRYFTWCRGLWNNVEASRSTVDVFEFDPNTMCPTDDIGNNLSAPCCTGSPASAS